MSIKKFKVSASAKKTIKASEQDGSYDKSFKAKGTTYYIEMLHDGGNYVAKWWDSSDNGLGYNNKGWVAIEGKNFRKLNNVGKVTPENIIGLLGIISQYDRKPGKPIQDRLKKEVAKLIDFNEINAACGGKKKVNASGRVGRPKLKPRDSWVHDDACRYSLMNGKNGDIENSNNKAELIRKCKQMSDPAWVEDNMLGGIEYSNKAQSDIDNGVTSAKKSVKSSKQFGVKASANAKRLAKKRVMASTEDDTIVMYWDGQKVYEGEVDGNFTRKINWFLDDPEHLNQIVDYCNSFGDPVITDTSDTMDVAATFAEMVAYELSEAAAIDDDPYISDEAGHFEIFKKSQEVKSSRRSKGKKLVKASANAERRAKKNVKASIDSEYDTRVLTAVEEYINDNYPIYVGVDAVDYRSETDWVVDIYADGLMVDEDFQYFLSENNPYLWKRLSDSGLLTKSRSNNVVTGEDYSFQFYEAQGQWRAPTILIDKKVLEAAGDDGSIQTELSYQIKDYEAQYIETLQEINYHISSFLADYDKGSVTGASKSIKCASSDNFNDFDETMRFRVCSYFDDYFRSMDDCRVVDDFDEAVDFAHECLGKGPTTIEDYEVGTLKIYPDEYWENFDGEFWCMPELTEFRDAVWKSMGIGAATDIKCALGSRSEVSDEEYNNALADEVSDILAKDGYGDVYISVEPEAITFTLNGEAVYIQPADEITPNLADIYGDSKQLAKAVEDALMDRYDNEAKAMQEAWEDPDIDDPDYATRAITLAEDFDLEPIMGEGEEDMGFGFNSNGDPLTESDVETLYHIAEYEILPKSELAKIDEYVSIDEDSWKMYIAPPYAGVDFYIHFKLSEKDVDLNEFVLPDAKMVPDFNYYTASLDFDIYTKDGELTDVVLEGKEIRNPDGSFSDYMVDRFGEIFNEEAIINYVEKLAENTVKDIYNGVTNL